MPANATNPDPAPLFSVLITVYNDWDTLVGCLRAIGEQVDPPSFEVIVVDDGSKEPAPDSVREWQNSYALTIIREPHAGIPAGRNRGVRESKGEILLFTDADCRLDSNCLSELARAIAQSPQHSCFQLHLAGDCSTLLGRAEELRVIALQDQTLLPDGRIRLLNTAGFAIRRSHPSVQEGPFDSDALRGEDTLLLANLMQNGELPLFVPTATVRHSVSLSPLECLRKDLRSGWLEAITFKSVSAKGVRIRMSNGDRLRMLYSTWKTAGQRSLGRTAWAVLITRQLVERTLTVLYQCLPGK
jgi:glycosyltransferase involved in cell wall biosynthesis